MSARRYHWCIQGKVAACGLSTDAIASGVCLTGGRLGFFDATGAIVRSCRRCVGLAISQIVDTKKQQTEGHNHVITER